MARWKKQQGQGDPKVVGITDKASQHPRVTRQTYAALDLGTNNCRMLIAEPARSGYRVIDSVSRAVSLGEDLEHLGRISPESAGRIIHAVKLCAARLRKHEVERMFLVATEACRKAVNGRDVLNQVRKETGLRLEIIRPELEARLALTSCAPLISDTASQVLVFDIGGGSTELIWIDLNDVPQKQRRRALLALAPLRGKLSEAGALGAKIVDWISVPLGVATLHQRYSDVADDRARFALMSWYFEEFITAFAPYDMDQEVFSDLQIIGTSGTVTTIASAHLGLDRYSRDKVDGIWMANQEVESTVDRILNMSHEERLRHPGIGGQRVSLIVSGVAILQTILRIWPVPRLRVADRGLREGILHALMHEDGHSRASVV